MSHTNQTTRKLLLIGLLILLPAAIAKASNDKPPIPKESLDAQQQRLIREHEEAGRTIPPSPPRVTDNGIVEISLDTVLDSVPSSTGDKQTSNKALQSLSASSLLAGPKMACLTKAFPEVAWQVCVTDMGMKGLWIDHVNLRRTPTGPWMRVVYQAGLADIFVPYHQTNFRPYDLRYATKLDTVTNEDQGSNGTLITLTNETAPTVVAEVRDRGVGWMCKGAAADKVTPDFRTRRAEELLVWGVSDAGNYDNIIQYGFRDDGTISFRMGNTGYNDSNVNNPGLPFEAHTHNGLWRVDMDLNGAGGDTAYWLRHIEPLSLFGLNILRARDLKSRFQVEGGKPWIASELNSILIEDNAGNAFGNRLGYEFVPVQAGTSRHYGANESWTSNDFYVTVFDSGSLDWITAWDNPDNYLLPDVNAKSPASNADLVVWVKASAHHNPTDEDRSSNDVSNGRGLSGVTLTHWSGFDVVPHNLFDTNPLGGPLRCSPPDPLPPPCDPDTC